MRHLFQDQVFIKITKACALGVVLILVLLLGSQLILSWPAITKFGIKFFYTNDWNPVTENFGALSAIIGTILTSVIAIVVAVPVSFGVAILLTQILPQKLATVISRLFELMAGVPSIVYGMWGLFVLVPFLSAYVEPKLINHFSHIPVINFLFAGYPIGISIFTAGIILAVMIIPLIASMMRDVISNIPELVIEAAYGIGATRWQVTSKIIVHYARAGLFGSVILGLGRALGETMAVTFVVGNSHLLPSGLFTPGTTISATIANEFTEATGKIYPASIVYLSLILFIITLVTLLFSRYFLAHAKVRGGNL